MRSIRSGVRGQYAMRLWGCHHAGGCGVDAAHPGIPRDGRSWSSYSVKTDTRGGTAAGRTGPRRRRLSHIRLFPLVAPRVHPASGEGWTGGKRACTPQSLARDADPGSSGSRACMSGGKCEESDHAHRVAGSRKYHVSWQAMLPRMTKSWFGKDVIEGEGR